MNMFYLLKQIVNTVMCLKSVINVNTQLFVNEKLSNPLPTESYQSKNFLEKHMFPTFPEDRSNYKNQKCHKFGGLLTLIV